MFGTIVRVDVEGAVVAAGAASVGVVVVLGAPGVGVGKLVDAGSEILAGAVAPTVGVGPAGVGVSGAVVSMTVTWTESGTMLCTRTESGITGTRGLS